MNKTKNPFAGMTYDKVAVNKALALDFEANDAFAGIIDDGLDYLLELSTKEMTKELDDWFNQRDHVDDEKIFFSSNKITHKQWRTLVMEGYLQHVENFIPKYINKMFFFEDGDNYGFWSWLANEKDIGDLFFKSTLVKAMRSNYLLAMKAEAHKWATSSDGKARTDMAKLRDLTALASQLGYSVVKTRDMNGLAPDVSKPATKKKVAKRSGR